MVRSCLYIFLLICIKWKLQGQIVNYVQNGSFEEATDSSFFKRPVNWTRLAEYKYWGAYLCRYITPFNVPTSNYSDKWPRTGNNYFATTLFFPTTQWSNRGYPRNHLKSKLTAGRSYCVIFYLNLTWQSTHGISSISVLLADSTVDTIQVSDRPLSYLSPQVNNPLNNIITDTVGWTKISGTFIANGTEKYLLIGNFRTDENTPAALKNSANLPMNFADYFIDDVSLIDIDLPAFAGPDRHLIAGDSTYLGRERDVGIDEACTWFKLPNDSIAIDTAAGIWVKPVGTATYMVRQEICGNVKWDTVVVKEDFVGLKEQRNNALRIYPNPADDYVELSFTGEKRIGRLKYTITNQLGVVKQEGDFPAVDGKYRVDTSGMDAGVYFLRVVSGEGNGMGRFVICR
jgi:hypothetical protein